MSQSQFNDAKDLLKKMIAAGYSSGLKQKGTLPDLTLDLIMYITAIPFSIIGSPQGVR